jgi:hypothetical protein
VLAAECAQDGCLGGCLLPGPQANKVPALLQERCHGVSAVKQPSMAGSVLPANEGGESGRRACINTTRVCRRTDWNL